MNELQNYFKLLVEECDKLKEELYEKNLALDKACEELEKASAHKVDTDYYGRTSFMSKEKWKEWCMNGIG